MMRTLSLFFTLCCALVCCAVANAVAFDTPHVYYRVPQFHVNETIVDFVHENGIHNCFSTKMSENNMWLKCYLDGRLMNVIVQVFEASSSMSV